MISKTKIKYIQSLGQKKFRQEERLFTAEGPKLAAELIREAPEALQEIFAVKEWIENNKNLSAHIQYTEITEAELERISQLTTPNQVLAIVRQFENNYKADYKNKLVLALDGIQDPGNMGTIIRTADWFGINQLVCSHDCADIYNPKVVQATMGSIARVKIAYQNMEEWLVSCKEVRIYAAALEGKEISTLKKMNEGIVIIGNESKGISPGVMQLANVKITIGKKGKAESLNAAVAAGIILSHLT